MSVIFGLTCKYPLAFSLQSKTISTISPRSPNYFSAEKDPNRNHIIPPRQKQGTPAENYKLCWAWSSAYHVQAGTLTVNGPVSFSKDDGSTLSPIAGETFILQINGVGLSTDDRIRIVDDDVSCGSGTAHEHRYLFPRGSHAM